MRLKLPPYGAALAERLKWQNLPFMVVVCVGLNAWTQAKIWAGSPNDISPLVLPDGDSPKVYKWPVKECFVLVQRLQGPTDIVITDLIYALLSAGAARVVIWSKHQQPELLQYWAEK